LSALPAFLLSCFPAFLLSCFPAFLLACFTHVVTIFESRQKAVPAFNKKKESNRNVKQDWHTMPLVLDPTAPFLCFLFFLHLVTPSP